MNEREYNKLMDKMFIERESTQTEMMVEISNMVNSLAHELRNPLNIINTASYLLKKKLGEYAPDGRGTADGIYTYLSQINDSVRRAENIIANTLEMTRPPKREMEVLDVVSIIEQVLSFICSVYINKNISVVKKFSEVPAIEGNLNTIRLIFLNLIPNIIQSMPSGGELAIETFQNQQLDDESVSIRISVSNIENKDDQNKLFKPFFSDKEGLAWFGLYFAKKGVERHKGRLDVHSEDGKETIIIELPIKQENN